MRTFFSYLYPATVLHFGLVLLYDMLWMAGLSRPLDEWWLSLQSLQMLVYLAAYLAFVILIGTLGVVQRWNLSLRWILEMGSRRGLCIGGVPILDFVVIGLLGGVLLAAANLGPDFFGLLLFLVGPLLLVSILNLVFSLPPHLHVIAERDQTLADLAHAVGCDPAALARENLTDERQPVGFAGELRLPPR